MPQAKVDLNKYLKKKKSLVEQIPMIHHFPPGHCEPSIKQKI